MTIHDYATFRERTFGSEEVLELVSDKWTVQVLHAVLDGYNRFGEIRRALPTISQRMLTLRLRELERNGLLKRIDYRELPVRVEYKLMPLGESLCIRLRALCQWSKQNQEAVEDARRTFDMTAIGKDSLTY